jgi:acyl transferase domain-containing protein/NADPH-dependent curcumin reductase CurA/NAD(P)-dependent dehydrogenase (short-subunit alcohol dehydrogenase family)
MSNGENSLSSAKLALAIRKLRSEVDTGLLGSEPIAIVGMGCRLPGGIASTGDYWRFLISAGDGVSEVPADRWAASEYYDADLSAPGKMTGRWGSFLDGADLFDPVFFGISPREAAVMDPQQRLALEVAWEAIHDSGRAPEQLAGTSTGVFMAIYNSDYNRLLLADQESIGANTCAGGSHSMASGRISFLLDLRGPAISIDSACSSSLVSIHLAVQSLRSRDCDTALAGGVSLRLTPEHYLCLSKLAMLSPDGRCHTFDSAANGFVPGEGCGVVVLKRLSDALAAGDRIHAVIRGSAAGQDGRTASLTAPNGLAQQQVIRAALENARVDPADIGYVETHGTGTALGDPIEVEALAQVIGSGSKPCALGAVKSNFGHLEAAAGVAGLIKAALVLENGEIPANLHYHSLNPHISLEGTRFHVPVKAAPWTRHGGPRLAGVSAFGFTGTNAHLVLEEPPQMPARRDPPARPGPYLLAVSARTSAALSAYTSRWAEFLHGEGRQYAVDEICRNAALRRDHYEERLAVFGTTHDELRARLEESVSAGPSSTVSRGRASLNPGPVAFVFSGQGSQWPQMGAALIRTEPLFAAAIDRCEALIREEAGWSLKEVLEAGEADSLLQRTAYAQPAIFAVQTALAELWRSWGVLPAIVLGHSVGEIAAAHAAGVIGLREAVRIAVQRGRLMDAATGRGRMLSVALPAAAVEAGIPDSVSIAAYNAPASTVVSGDAEAIEQLAKEWQARGISARMLPVDYAFHSAEMDTVRSELPAVLGAIETREPTTAIVSTVSGTLAAAGDYQAEYWGRNVRHAVRFQQAVECALARGASTFLEIGPHAVVASAVSECALPETAVIASLRRNRDERATLAAALGRFYTLGYALDWKSVCGESRAVIPLPAYPYQRRRYWTAEVSKAAPGSRAEKDPGFALPGAALRSPALRGRAWQTTIGPEHPLVCGHQIAGSTVFPLAGFLNAAAAAWKQCSGNTAVRITGVEIGDALQIAEPIEVQTVVEDGQFEIYSLAQEEWKKHAAGRLQAIDAALEAVPAGSAPGALGVEDYYRAMHDSGLEYGPRYRTIRELSAGDGYAAAVVSVEADAAQLAGPIAPALLDGCLQTVLAASGDTASLYMPTRIECFDLYRAAGTAVRCRMRAQRAAEDGALTADFDLADETGAMVAAGRGLRLKRVRTMQTAYEVRWEKSERRPVAQSGSRPWLIVTEGAGDAAGDAVLQGLSLRGVAYARRAAGDDFGAIEPGGYRGVLYLAAGDTREGAYASALQLVQQLAAANATAECELWLATRNAQRVTPDDDCEGHAQAVVWGLARTAALEYPDLRCVRVDLDDSPDAAAALAEEMLSPGSEDELAFRGRDRYAASVVRAPLVSARQTARRLVIRQRGSLDGLSYEPAVRRTPGEDEVEIEVQTTALNFRDVLNALGAYPGDPGPLGLEFCGRVVSAGHGVTNCQPGDVVMGLGWGSFADVFVAKAALVTPIPAGLDAEAAVTLPNAFATAYHCLVTVGRIKKGDRVLIHAAAGGVGMMAVQIALDAGAEVFATAGSDQKREFVRSLGVRHVFDSRKTGFAVQVLEASGGAGVDLALNSLAGDFIGATLSAVANGGRFVEIGKTGIWSAERVAELGRDIRYSIVDLGPLLDHEPGVIAGYLREVGSAVERGAIRPLPASMFGFDRAADAFRFMAQARHTGKIVLRHAAAERTFSGTWLLTGGLGALGLEMARWLAARGASTIVLAGRHAPAGEAIQAVEELKQSGVGVETRACDVSRREQVAALLEAVRAGHGPLRGVVHLAGTLDDGVLTQQTEERFERVFAAKGRGAWNLHELVEGEDLRYFVLFSSAAAVLGSPAQGNYAAANAALDGLANYRAARHLPAVSIAWGAWADVGMAARVESSGARRTMPLLRPVRAADYLTALEEALESGRSNVALLSADWQQWRQMTARSRTRVAAAAASQRSEPTTAATRSIAEQLAELPASRRRKTAVDYLRAQAVHILGLGDTYRIDENEPLMRLGLDSLMALELRNTLARSFSRPLPATLLFDQPTLGALAAYFVGPLEAAPSQAAPAGDALLDGIAGLTDEEAEQLLERELSNGTGS